MSTSEDYILRERRPAESLIPTLDGSLELSEKQIKFLLHAIRDVDPGAVDAAEKIRKRVLEVQSNEAYPYPCIRGFHYICLFMSDNDAFAHIMKASQSTGQVNALLLLDIGCCMGTDLRHLVQSGYPSMGVIGCDIRQDFIDLGHSLYADRDTCPIAFFVADVFDITLRPFPQTADSVGPALKGVRNLNELRGRVKYVYAGALFHLFDEGTQEATARRLATLLDVTEGSGPALIFGRHSAKAEEGIISDAFGLYVEHRASFFSDTVRALAGVLGRVMEPGARREGDSYIFSQAAPSRLSMDGYVSSSGGGRRANSPYLQPSSELFSVGSPEIAGIGAGALQLLAMIVSADMYSIRVRSRSILSHSPFITLQGRGLPQALSNFALAVGLGLGGPVGGILNDLFGWRFAFLCQVPLFVLVMIVVTNTLRYVTPGQGQSAKEILSRIDFGGLITLFLMIGSTLTWLSSKFNEDLPWTDCRVVIPLTLSLLSLGLLLLIECCIAPEPILPPSLLTNKVPALVSLTNYFLGVCNFSIMYFIPLWFQTVSLDSASIAGLHLLPLSLAMGLGSLMSGWWIHRTGKYTTFSLVCGILPLSGLISITFMQEDSGFILKWFSVFPIGFGNAVVFLTILSMKFVPPCGCLLMNLVYSFLRVVALQAHLPESSIAFGTAVAQLFRGLGQISSVAIASAVFQSRLDSELRRRIDVPDAEKVSFRFHLPVYVMCAALY
ncbi:major facilitator superfamily domain-containing protein [Lanmaoa asiatica]|nr:major facilitator superfamily domain-containing protein [Lanmaoa asiatica]